MISGSRDKNLRSYNVRSDLFLPGETVTNAHDDNITTLDTDKEQTTLYSGCKDGIVKVWDFVRKNVVH